MNNLVPTADGFLYEPGPLGEVALEILRKLRKLRDSLMFAGFCPDEGEALRADMIMKRTLTDRDANLELGLFTNVAPGDTITHATITEPSGGNYTRKTLTDASWVGAADTRTYATQTFTPTGSGYTGTIQGYFINTLAAGGTKRLIAVEVDSAGGPYTLNENDTYDIDLSVVFSG